MNRKTKYVLLVIAFIIIAMTIVITNRFVRIFAEEEYDKIELWAEATQRVLNDEYSDFAFKILQQNENIPVVVVDEDDKYVTARNFDEPDEDTEIFYKEQIERLKYKNEPIVIELGEGEKQYIYYDDSLVLKQLVVFPYIQLVVIVAFILLIFWVVMSEKSSDLNKIWVGLSKETAHQLGTPISSMRAWIEVLKLKYPDDNLFGELEQDVDKMAVVTDRFSKIGWDADLRRENVVDLIKGSVDYMKVRSPKNVEYSFNVTDSEIYSMVSKTLFEWVIENLIKNALDAMITKDGRIDIYVARDGGKIVIDVSDTGKGMEKKVWKEVFKPGYTTKSRGWGLGLSLAKRIIHTYHNGEIFVCESIVNKGSRFRIILQDVSK